MNPALLRRETGLFEIAGEDLSGGPVNQLAEECQNKSSPSLDWFLQPFLSFGWAVILPSNLYEVLYYDPDGFENTNTICAGTLIFISLDMHTLVKQV